MKKSAFTLVEIMIVVAIIALLAAIAVPGILRARLTANDTAAKSAISAVSTAAENFAAATGTYPSNITDLTGANPKYLSAAPSVTGYNVTYNWAYPSAGSGYIVYANATGCNTTGTKDFSISTGAVITDQACS